MGIFKLKSDCIPSGSSLEPVSLNEVSEKQGVNKYPFKFLEIKDTVVASLPSKFIFQNTSLVESPPVFYPNYQTYADSSKKSEAVVSGGNTIAFSFPQVLDTWKTRLDSSYSEYLEITHNIIIKVANPSTTDKLNKVSAGAELGLFSDPPIQFDLEQTKLKDIILWKGIDPILVDNSLLISPKLKEQSVGVYHLPNCVSATSLGKLNLLKVSDPSFSCIGDITDYPLGISRVLAERLNIPVSGGVNNLISIPNPQGDGANEFNRLKLLDRSDQDRSNMKPYLPKSGGSVSGIKVGGCSDLNQLNPPVKALNLDASIGKVNLTRNLKTVSVQLPRAVRVKSGVEWNILKSTYNSDRGIWRENCWSGNIDLLSNAGRDIVYLLTPVTTETELASRRRGASVAVSPLGGIFCDEAYAVAKPPQVHTFKERLILSSGDIFELGDYQKESYQFWE